jgi:hypothetical protein
MAVVEAATTNEPRYHYNVVHPLPNAPSRCLVEHAPHQIGGSAPACAWLPNVTHLENFVFPRRYAVNYAPRQVEPYTLSVSPPPNYPSVSTADGA